MYKYLLIIVFFIIGCNNAKDKARDAISKAGETVGQSTTEFAKAVSEGVDKSLGSEIQLSQALTAKGIKTGKFKIASSADASDNILSLYLIFNNDFKGDISIKIFDSKGLEYGRLKQNIAGKEGEAKFVDFSFDKRTNIESRSKFVIDNP